LGSEPVSVHEDPQQATGQVIIPCHCPVTQQVCSSVPTHRVWPAVQTPMHWPPTQVCPTQGGLAVHWQEGLQNMGVLPLHCACPTTQVLQQAPSMQGAPPQGGWLCQ
jgi:hypothetical protein